MNSNLMQFALASDPQKGRALCLCNGWAFSSVAWAFFFSSVLPSECFGSPIFTPDACCGKRDTLSTMLMLIGFALFTMDDFSLSSWLLFVKIMGVVLFIFISTPTSSHALMRAAFEDDEMPMTEEDLKKSKKRGEKEVKWDSNFSIPSFCFSWWPPPCLPCGSRI